MTPGFSTLLFSDFHAGHHEAYGERKFLALEAMMRRAKDLNIAEIVLAGDIADERPDRVKVREECRRLREAIDGHPSVYLRGNHDDASFFGTDEMEEMLRCTIDERPWHVSPVSGVVVTHGHHFRTPAMRKALRTATLPEDLDILHASDKARRHLATMTKSFSAFGRFGFRLQKAGFPATEIWEHTLELSQRSRSRIARALRPSPVRTLGKRTWRDRFADAIDLRSVRHAARLARTMKCWGVVSGHTHVPGIYKHYLKDEATGERVPFLVGNSGSFISRYAPTCIEVRYPKMVLWQYNPLTHRMTAVQEMELTPEELAVQERVLGNV